VKLHEKIQKFLRPDYQIESKDHYYIVIIFRIREFRSAGAFQQMMIQAATINWQGQALVMGTKLATNYSPVTTTAQLKII